MWSRVEYRTESKALLKSSAMISVTVATTAAVVDTVGWISKAQLVRRLEKYWIDEFSENIQTHGQ